MFDTGSWFGFVFDTGLVWLSIVFDTGFVFNTGMVWLSIGLTLVWFGFVFDIGMV